MLKSNPQMTDPKTQLTTAQKNALNSGVTSSVVSQVSTNTSDISTLKGKHIYCHCLKFGANDPGYVTTMILNTSATAFTFSSMLNWLYTNGFRDNGASIENNNKRYWCTGAGSGAYINMISAPNTSTIRWFYGGYMQSTKTTTSVSWFTDTVIQLL